METYTMFKTITTTLAALTLVATATAQCPQPDNLDGGPCCSPTQVALPTFPGFKQKSLHVCWLDCDVDGVGNCQVKWSKPRAGSGGTCGPMTSFVRTFDPAGNLTWRGKVRLNYSRTWMEVGNSQQTYQVWRFLVTGDLRPTNAAGSSPCPVPACHSAFGRIKHTGYVDWALDCANNTWSNAWMLTHACDKIDHDPGYPRGGSFHPGRSFTFVGPAAGFALGPVFPGEGGGGAAEGVRRIRSSTAAGAIGVPVCEYEEQIQFSVMPLAQYCACSANGLNQWQESDVFISGACGTTITGSGGVTLPALLSMGIGRWTNPNAYPGTELLRYNVSDYTVLDGCSGVTQHEYAFGVTTMDGFAAFQLTANGIGGQLPPVFIDQVNSMRKIGGPLLNVPSHASRVINLNH